MESEAKAKGWRPPQPMGAGELLDATFRLYRARFGLFFGIFALVELPISLISLALAVTGGGAGAGGSDVPFLMAGPSGPFAVAVGALAVLHWIVAYPVLNGAAIRATADSLEGRAVGIGQTYRAALGRFWPLIGTAILAGLAAVLGAVLLVIPGIILGLRYLVAHQAVMLEGVAYRRALGQSRRHTAGDLWRLFLLYILFMVLLLVIEVALNAPLGVLVAFLGLPPALAGGITNMVASLASAVTMPLGSIFSTLLYFDLLLRKEGADLERMASQLESVRGIRSAPPAE